MKKLKRSRVTTQDEIVKDQEKAETNHVEAKPAKLASKKEYFLSKL